jgi:hypothetical protein
VIETLVALIACPVNLFVLQCFLDRAARLWDVRARLELAFPKVGLEFVKMAGELSATYVGDTQFANTRCVHELTTEIELDE